jgi:ubiquinone biosynthesis protein COQ4
LGRDFSPEHAYVRDRVRDSHDLFHTLTGYGVDLFGEAGVLAFTFGQTENKGWAVLVFFNVLVALLSRRLDGLVVAWKGYRRGRRARYLPAVVDWERLLQVPLDEARLELGISPLEPYRPLDTENAFSGTASSAG